MWGKKRVYLDVAAGMKGNPSSPHAEGRAAKARLEAAREKIARLLEVKADDVVFTSGATEANALAILGYVRAARKRHRNNAHVLYLPSSHASVVENMLLLKEEGVIVEPMPIREGLVDLDALAKLITPNTVFASLDAVCGETGTIWNTREVGDLLHKKNVIVHVDASQAPLTEKITRSHFGADMVTFDISKVSLERGLGVLVAHRTIPLEPLYRGGGQERGLRPGSEAPYAAELFAEGLESAVKGRETFVARAAGARAELIIELFRRVPEAMVNEGREQSPNILNISLSGRDTDYLVALLDEAGFAVSTRSACETDSEHGSRAVLALTGDSSRAKSTLRISWGPSARSRDVTKFVESLEKALKIAG
jgi:cysteine desulfurase